MCVCVCCTGKGRTGKGRSIRETLRTEKSHLIGKRHHRSQTRTRKLFAPNPQRACSTLQLSLKLFKSLQNHAQLAQISSWQTFTIPTIPAPATRVILYTLHCICSKDSCWVWYGLIVFACCYSCCQMVSKVDHLSLLVCMNEMPLHFCHTTVPQYRSWNWCYISPCMIVSTSFTVLF